MEKNPASPEFNGESNTILCQTSGGEELRGNLLRLPPNQVIFELCAPHPVLRMSEVLNNFRAVTGGHVLRGERAVVTNLVNTGPVLVCEAAITEPLRYGDCWIRPGTRGEGAKAYHEFTSQWQRVYKIAPDYKVLVGDLQAYLSEVRLWMEGVELEIRAFPGGNRLEIENNLARELAEPVVPAISSFFDRFEELAAKLPEEYLPIHRHYVRRQTHPLLMSSPFLYRTFTKPLGYAGDYEMVSMILRDPCEGASLYAKVVNQWFLAQAPAEAHRNRIHFLVDRLVEETARVAGSGRTARVLNLGCGPANEVQRFIAEHSLSERAEFTLLDFNEETVRHAHSVLESVMHRSGRLPKLQVQHKSVNQILKEATRAAVLNSQSQYDFIYCAGLFDYLSDQVCRRLMTLLYSWLAPGGLLLATNVHPSNPRRHTMDLVMEWNLIYRDAAQMAAIRPTGIEAQAFRVTSDLTGVNVYGECRKPAGVP
jgi:extracellular factor (EF) 3-hydroxypalmitic acid methyl ester biosynthesis protein